MLMSLGKNFTALSAVQLINVIVPLLVYPFLLRKLSIEHFGLVLFAQAVIGYFTQFTDYGFSNTAVRSIVLHRNNKETLALLFFTILQTRIVLCAISFLPFIALLTFISPSTETLQLFLLSFTLVIGQSLSPYWFFQGVERMNYQTIMNLMSKVIFAILVFLFIREERDFTKVNLFMGLGSILSSFFGLFVIKYQNTFHFRFIRLPRILRELKAGFTYFISSFATFIATNSIIVIIGTVMNPVAAGYYGLAEKVMLAIRSLAIVIYQTTYPQVCQLAANSLNDLKAFHRTLLLSSLVLFIFLSLLTYTFSMQIVYLFSGEEATDSNLVLQLICVAPILTALTIPAAQLFLAYALRQAYTFITIFCSVAGILFSYLFIVFNGLTGASIAVVLSELLTLLAFYSYLFMFHKNLLPFSNWSFAPSQPQHK